MDTSWLTACKNLTPDENIPDNFQLILPHPLFLYENLALHSIFLNYPLQNSNAVHVPLAWKHYKSYFSYHQFILHWVLTIKRLRNHWYWYIYEMRNKHKTAIFSSDIAKFNYVLLMKIFWNLQNEFIIIIKYRKPRFRHRVPGIGKKLSNVEIPTH